MKKLTVMGYKGVVFRYPDVPYHDSRSKHLLKYKFFKEADLRIIGVIDGEKRLAGMPGSLVIEVSIDGLCVKSCVGTGLTN